MGSATTDRSPTRRRTGNSSPPPGPLSAPAEDVMAECSPPYRRCTGTGAGTGADTTPGTTPGPPTRPKWVTAPRTGMSTDR
ncbi:hypothetical protein ACIQWZ_19425 [Streptomyces sp. NPDC098077]|uniref:hypothetical protein n=1 Tax=Streptomyces sp. NPDC098077 TaxID=3366093 RepID=UPI00381E6FB6